MLIEQIIEFQLRGPGPPDWICTPATGYFMTKQKSLTENLPVDYCLLLKYCWRQCTLLSSAWAKLFPKLIPKCKISNMFWAYIVS